jgi:hypothetical protein
MFMVSEPVGRTGSLPSVLIAKFRHSISAADTGLLARAMVCNNLPFIRLKNDVFGD